MYPDIDSVPAFNARKTLVMVQGGEAIDEIELVFGLLKDFDCKKEDIVVLFKNSLKGTDFQVNDMGAEAVVTRALEALKKDGKADNANRSYWHKI